MPAQDATHKRDFRGLLKLAFAGQTVGDFMHAWNADLGADPSVRNSAFGKINSSGIDVKQPASRIPYILGGGVAAGAAASYLGANPFWRGVATVGGALYGNHMFNKSNKSGGDFKVAPGLVFRGF